MKLSSYYLSNTITIGKERILQTLFLLTLAISIVSHDLTPFIWQNTFSQDILATERLSFLMPVSSPFHFHSLLDTELSALSSLRTGTFFEELNSSIRTTPSPLGVVSERVIEETLPQQFERQDFMFSTLSIQESGFKRQGFVETHFQDIDKEPGQEIFRHHTIRLGEALRQDPEIGLMQDAMRPSDPEVILVELSESEPVRAFSQALPSRPMEQRPFLSWEAYYGKDSPFLITNFKSQQLRLWLMKLAPSCFVPLEEIPFRFALIKTLLSPDFQDFITIFWLDEEEGEDGKDEVEEQERKELRRRFFYQYIDNIEWEKTVHKRLFLIPGDTDMHRVDLEAFNMAYDFPETLGIRVYKYSDLCDELNKN